MRVVDRKRAAQTILLYESGDGTGRRNGPTGGQTCGSWREDSARDAAAHLRGVFHHQAAGLGRRAGRWALGIKIVIVQRMVTPRFRSAIEVKSEPRDTQLIVPLPLDGPAGTQSQAKPDRVDASEIDFQNTCSGWMGELPNSIQAVFPQLLRRRRGSGRRLSSFRLGGGRGGRRCLLFLFHLLVMVLVLGRALRPLSG